MLGLVALFIFTVATGGFILFREKYPMDRSSACGESGEATSWASWGFLRRVGLIDHGDAGGGSDGLRTVHRILGLTSSLSVGKWEAPLQGANTSGLQSRTGQLIQKVSRTFDAAIEILQIKLFIRGVGVLIRQADSHQDAGNVH